jgi:hypothetical protein
MEKYGDELELGEENRGKLMDVMGRRKTMNI